jgi:hypothetical protein
MLMDINNINDALMELHQVFHKYFPDQVSFQSPVSHEIMAIIRQYGEKQYKVGYSSGWKDGDNDGYPQGYHDACVDWRQ